MRVIRVPIGAVLLAALLFGSAASRARAVAITNVSLVDVTAGTIEANSTVIITGDTISAAGRQVVPPRAAQVVDATGKFLIPGLWDMHAHYAATGEGSPELYVANGVTGTRDMGSDLDLVLRLRNETASATRVGPMLVVAGPILDDAPADWPFRRRVRTAAEGREAVRMLGNRGVDFVKVHDRTSRDAYFAIVQEARTHGLPVDGHVPMSVTLREAADAGQRTVEHLANFRVFTECSSGSTYRPEACRSFFAGIAKRRQWHTPTLAATSIFTTLGTPADDPVASHHAFAPPRYEPCGPQTSARRRDAGDDPQVQRSLAAGAPRGARHASRRRRDTRRL
jgi:hypothetical protein